MIKLTEQRPDGVCVYTLENDQLKAVITSYGATVMELDVKKEDGTSVNVALGYETVDEYQAKSGTYFGAVVGRTANRLAFGQFRLNGKDYSCAITNPPHSLHGGKEGFSYKNFDSAIEGDKLVMTYHSPDMEEGYPGNLDFKVTFWLDGPSFCIDYEGQCDQDTLFSPTHHIYFNLNGGVAPIDDQLLEIHGVRHGIIDETVACQGNFREMQDTPLDFRTFAPISQAFDFEDEQIKYGGGIDHHFVFETDDPVQLILKEPNTGLTMDLSTTFGGTQIYSGNYLTGIQGRGDTHIEPHFGMGIEPQDLPDAIHNQEHPASILRAGDIRKESIRFTFKQN